MQRRITQNGNSLTISLPWPFMRALHLERGHLVILELIPEQQRVVLTPFLDVTDVDRTRWRIEGAIVAPRKVLAYGNSLSVAMPREFLHALFAFTGDRLLVRLHEERRALTITPLTKRVIGPDPPARSTSVVHYKG